MKISEIFYSIQGEGLRVGTPTIFIRLTGCKAKFACYNLGIRCDTEFESGKEFTIKQIEFWISVNAPDCKDITWTGGEPTDQLTEEIVSHFKEMNFHQSIETSGLNKVPKGIDYIAISPKVAEHVIKKNFSDQIVDELRYIRHSGQAIPNPSIKAKNYYLSPHSDGFQINVKNVNHCIDLIKQNPKWKLSIQSHKIWNVL